MKNLIRPMLPLLRNSPMRRKIVRFALIGVGNTLVDFSVFTVAYKVAGLPIVASNVVAWMVAVSGSYVLNTYITFHVESGRLLRYRDYLTFAASGVLGMVMTTAVLLLLSHYLHVMVAKAISILVGFAVNFTMSNLVVFRARPPSA
ncbi:MAG: GtrA family protein [Xanthobacteraceae bacterium]|nr:GtrA family protein [Xanthobacteraceae bacterium]